MIDRRSEFTDPMKVEADPETGEIPCRVLYCAPMNSNQKSNRSLENRPKSLHLGFQLTRPIRLLSHPYIKRMDKDER